MLSNHILRVGVRQAWHETKFMGWVLLGALMLGMTGLQPAQRLYDEYARPRPWISASLEIIPGDDVGDEPLIIYDVQAYIPVRGSWTAWLEFNGRQICFGRGLGAYSPETKRNRIWPLHEWLGRTDCTLPPVPYTACVSYQVTTDSGVSGGFGPKCSPLFDPGKELP